GNSAWDIKNVTIITRIEPDDGVWGEKGYVFQYVFELERRSTYYIAVVVIPCFFIATVSIVGIFAPGTEHEPGDVIKEEWDMVEARLDFVGIAIFEAFNIINLLSLAYFAYLPTPDMKDWL
uniref:Uncharacterized protein n=1 Tax=Acrobeloides nanus TaxID=290746 RepID=A0A914EA55_9BILA